MQLPMTMADVDQDLFLSALPDYQLLRFGRDTVIATNRCFAQRIAYLVEFFERREATFNARLEAEPHFTLTARQETVVEVAPLWGCPEADLRRLLNNALFLMRHLPRLWDLVQLGLLDEHRTQIVVEAARGQLSGDRLASYDVDMTTWLMRQLGSVEDGQDFVTCTPKQLRNRVAYVRSRLRPADAQESFCRKYAARRTSVREGEDGMGWLKISNTIDQLRVVAKRLDLAARHLRAEGDERTLDQLRADLACDLIAGTITCDAAGVVTELPTNLFARPVINLTVPATTVMGLSDEPGMLSGGTVVPAGLARKLAQDPDATWFRMLTDPAGQMVELSTKSYQPTPPIIREVVARDVTCFRDGCDKPATECELDHHLRFPEGETSPDNLGPGCKQDHKAKHAPGFSLEQDTSGQWVFVTACGFRHPIRPITQPTADGIPELPLTELDFQFSVTELCDAIAWLRHERDRFEQHALAA